MSLFLGALALMASGVMAVAWRTPWRVSVLLLLLFLLGQCAVLAHVDAPPYAVYQHLRLGGALSVTTVLSWTIIAGQLATLVAYRATWRAQAEQLLALRDRTAHRLVLLVVVVGFASAIPAKDIVSSITEALSATIVMVLAFTTLVASFLALPATALRRFEAWTDERVTLVSAPDATPRRWDAHWGWWCAGWTLLVGLLVSRFVFEGVPHIDDSVSYLFQAKVLATGHLSAAAPPDSAAFQMDEILIRDGRWFGYGFPGWPAVLSIGAWLGVPWMVNPVISAVTVLLAHALLERLHGRGVANVVAMLMCVSPWMLFMTGEFLGHPAAALWLLLALVAVERCRERGGRDVRWAVMIGAAGGMLFLTRPLDAATGGLVVALWSFGLLGGERLSYRSLVIAGVASGAFVLIGMAYNQAITGDPMLSPYRMWTDAAWGAGRDRLGFGADIGNRAWPNIDPLPGHGMADVVLNLNKNLFQTNVDLFGWACGSLLLPVLYLTSRWTSREDRIWIALAVVLPAGYSLYWFSGGPDHGARYWYPLLVPFLLFTARSIERLHAMWRRPDTLPFVRPMVGVAVLAACLTFVPWRATTKYFRYREVGADLSQEVSRRGIQHALVFVHAPERETYQAGFNYNSPRLDGPDNVYARLLDVQSRERLTAHFADRDWWIAERVVSDPPRWDLSGPYHTVATRSQP